MSNEITPFEEIRRTNPAGNEFWSSRDFARVLGYVNYRHFQAVIEKARSACFNSGQRVDDHFVGIDEMVEIGSGAQRAIPTVMMSRYACYLVIQNADPAKEIVAQGQTYFAIQTRRQELSDAEMEEQRRLAIRSELRTHNSQLADAAKDAGVIEPRDYAIFQNHGYMGLGLPEWQGFRADDFHRRNLGFDVYAEKQGRVIRIEIKAHLREASSVFITSNERQESKKQPKAPPEDHWELWNVENLAGDAPGRVRITRYRHLPEDAFRESGYWVDLKSCHSELGASSDQKGNHA